MLTFGSSNDYSYLPELKVTYEYPIGERSFYSFEDEPLTDGLGLKVNVSTGNLIAGAHDFSFAGTGMDLSIDRFYNSLAAGQGENGGEELGGKWILGTGIDVFLRFFGDGHLGYYGPSGFAVSFYRSADGTFTSPSGLGQTIVKNGDNTYTLTFHHTGLKLNFNTSGLLSSQVDRNGNRISFTYTSGNWVPWRLASITDTRNRTTSFTYNSNDLLTKITDPAGRLYQYGYDSSFDLTTYTDPAGKITRFAYNGTWLSRITDPRGNYTDLGYDANQRVTSIKRVTNSGAGTGPTTTYQYDPGPTLCPETTWAGCTVSTDPNGNRTIYYYDEYRRVRKTVDALGNPQSATYTADDNIQTYTSASGGVVNNTYSTDGNNNLTESRLPTGATSKWTFGSTEFKYWATKASDAQGNDMSYEYQAGSGNLITVQNALASQNRAIFTYNPADGTPKSGTLATATDFKGNVTSYTYNTQGQLTLVDNPAPLGDNSYTYDTAGRVASITDGKGQTTTYAYDALDRVTSITYHGGAQIISVYDGNGNLASTSDNTGTTTYEYDKLNRMTKETLPGPKTNEYTYDLAGNMVTFTDAGGTVAYAYNALNLLATLTEPGGAQTTFVYDVDHMRTQTRYPNGVTQYMRYDASNRLDRIWAQKSPPSGPILTDFTYCFRIPLTPTCSTTGTTDTGLRQRVTDKDGNKTTYIYDVLNRLKKAEERSSADVLLRLLVPRHQAARRSGWAIWEAGNSAVSPLAERLSRTTRLDSAERLPAVARRHIFAMTRDCSRSSGPPSETITTCTMDLVL